MIIKDSARCGGLHALCAFLLLYCYLSSPFDIAILFGKALLLSNENLLEILNNNVWINDLVFIAGHSIEILLLSIFSVFIVIKLFYKEFPDSISCAVISTALYLPGAIIWEPRYSGLWLGVIWYVLLVGAGFIIAHHLTNQSTTRLRRRTV